MTIMTDSTNNLPKGVQVHKPQSETPHTRNRPI